MQPLANSLRIIFAAVDLSDTLEALKLFAAAAVIARQLNDMLARPGSHPSADYLEEKVSNFMTCFLSALHDSPREDGRGPGEWMEEAHLNLILVERELQP